LEVPGTAPPAPRAIPPKELNHPLIDGFHGDADQAEWESLANLLADTKSADPDRLRFRAPIARVAVGTALAMRYLHSQGVVHCNLSPDAILVDLDWNVRIGLLAHSRLPGEDSTVGHSSVSFDSRYFAPECYENRFEFASDVFSFGLILYRLIVGLNPFPDLTPFAVAKLIVADDARPEIPDFVPPRVRGLIADCWATDPDDRPPFDEIIERLEGMDFKLTSGVKSAKVANFVQQIRDWEKAGS
jgi:serine/threonine protein kinase